MSDTIGLPWMPYGGFVAVVYGETGSDFASSLRGEVGEDVRIVGIDPGLVITGYGILDQAGGRIELVDAGTIDSGGPELPLSVRLRTIHHDLNEMIDAYAPDAMALEQLYSHYEHPRTAILMGHARGVICLAAGLHDMPLYHYVAAQVKSSLTGNGRAPKAQIQHMVQRTFGLKEIPNPPDVADAIAIALCHIYHENGFGPAVTQALQRQH